jgi:hypothetical protein
MRLRIRLAFVVLLLGASLGSTACARVHEPAAADAEPASIQPISGSNLSRVVISEDASRSLDIQIGLVSAVPRAAVPAKRQATAKKASAPVATPATTLVPTTALVYDPQGTCWVYTSPAARTFVRAQVVVDHTLGDVAYLRSGPPVGTAVVTVGASELLGAEYGVGGE